MFSGTRYHVNKLKGMSADWGTETAQLELFPKLTSVRHCKDIYSESGIKYFAFSAQNFFFFFPIIKRLRSIVVCYLGLKHLH